MHCPDALRQHPTGPVQTDGPRRCVAFASFAKSPTAFVGTHSVRVIRCQASFAGQASRLGSPLEVDHHHRFLHKKEQELKKQLQAAEKAISSRW